MVFLGENAIASGENGLYYTSTGGVGASSWTRFEITGNATDSAIYENTTFTHCFSEPAGSWTSGFVYACGRDNASTKAVIFKIALPSLEYSIIYQGPENSKLNKIACQLGSYIAVGDNGLIVGFTDNSINTITTSITDDLLSVDKFQNMVLIGTSYQMYTAVQNETSLSSIQAIATPDIGHRDVVVVNSNNAYALNAESFTRAFITGGGTSVATIDNFYGPLNANGIINKSGFFVGTDHGIYRGISPAIFQNTTIEYQPSSQNHHVRDFWAQGGNTSVYAYGNNGLIMKTTNGGGATRPYVEITSNGGCSPGSIQLTALTGSSNSYTWLVNGNQVQTGTNNFSYNFPEAGSYDVTLNVQNAAGEQGSHTKTIHMVNLPEINKPVSVSDFILCKAESTQIQIENSEPGVYYILKREGEPNSNHGESGPGNGGTIEFTTNLIDVSGTYYIYAKNTLADCGDRFSSNLVITVEETKAEFHAGLINAAINEPIKFSQTSTDATNFDWQFPGASSATSSEANPIVSFASTGQKSATLHAWSNNDCHDTVTDVKTNIFEVPQNAPDCFMLANVGPDSSGHDFYDRPDISQMVPTDDGFLICGTYRNQIFDSEYGVIKSMDGKKGGYLTKYDRNGVVRWTVYNLNPQNATLNEDVIFSTAVDLEGNIYISGHGKGKFIDNAGTIADLSATFNAPGFYIMKLNADGEKIWYVQNFLVGFAKIKVDKENNLVGYSGYRNTHLEGAMYFNGVETGSLQSVEIYESDHLMVKFAPDGTLIWDAPVQLSVTPVKGFGDIQFDAANNMYISAVFDNSVKFYTPGSTEFQTVNMPGTFGSKPGIIKFNSDGILQWATRSKTINDGGIDNDTTTISAMTVDDDGTIYLTGRNNTGVNVWNVVNYTHVLESSDGSTITTQTGPFYAAKLSANGIWQWLRTAGLTQVGGGWQILKDGNKIYVLGSMSGNLTAGPGTGTFDSADGIGYELTTDAYDYFITTYNEEGILLNVSLNNENVQNAALILGANGFFKGDGNYFYLAKNLSPLDGGEIYHEFGMTSPSLIGDDGVVVRFTPDCAITKYNRLLGIDENDAISNLQLIPNPTSGSFSIDLHQRYEDVSVAIYDITGKLISQQKFNGISKVETSIEGEAGIYFLRLTIDNSQKLLKFIKQ